MRDNRNNGHKNKKGNAGARQIREGGRPRCPYPEDRRAIPENRFDNAPVSDTEASGLVVGRNAVRELLKSGRAIDKLLVQRGEREGSITVLVSETIARGVPVIECEKQKLDELSL
ncbi:MAG: hypothetical protein IKJ04_03730, partial [Clostridia bacterium]|nr:hypothetical protein [Clostridia bacterium]